MPQAVFGLRQIVYKRRMASSDVALPSRAASAMAWLKRDRD
jgi:hypothetical protein